MLKFDINPLLSLKGATSKMAYLYNRGITRNKSYHLIGKNVKSISISDIESLCKIFNCTPNDLFTFEESESNPLPDGSALKQLIRTPLPSLPDLVKDLSVEQATELLTQLQQLKNQK